MSIKNTIWITMTAGLLGLMSATGTHANDTGNGVKVAIVDSGCNSAHQEGISFIDETVRDYNGHGTLMAKIIKDVHPEAKLYIVKVIGKNGLVINEDALILGLEWAISRDVDVINMSLRLNDSAKLHAVIKKAHDNGILLVAAAGNKKQASGSQLSVGGSVSNIRHHTSNTDVAYPAQYPEVIAVGALNRYGEVCDFSAEGKDIDFFCKGHAGKKAGTSIASAYAAGLGAKIISENPQRDLQTIIRILLRH